MAEDDLYGLLGDEPTPEQQARAYAAALRGQRPPVPAPQPQFEEQRAQANNLGRWGALLSSTGGESLGSAGEAFSKNAQEQIQDLDKREAIGARFQRADRHYAVKGKDGAIYDFDPISGNSRKVQDAPDAPDSKQMNVPGVGLVDVKRDGSAAKVLLHAPPKVARAGGGDKNAGTDKELSDLEARMSASGPRAGNLGIDYARRVNAQNLKTILQQPVNTPQMVAEATAALAKLISGGQVTEHTMDLMMPQTAHMALENRLQYVFGHPRDAGVGEFLQYMGHTADREDANAAQRMKAERMSRLSAHPDMYKRRPEDVGRIMSRFDLTPEDIASAFTAPVEGKAQKALGGKQQEAAPLASAGKFYLHNGKGQRIAATPNPDGKTGVPLPGAKLEPDPDFKPVASK